MDINENKIDINTTPDILMPVLNPKAMDNTAPNDAPETIPIVPPSANGFLKSPCIEAPVIDKIDPTRAAASTLGNLTCNIIEERWLLSTPLK